MGQDTGTTEAGRVQDAYGGFASAGTSRGLVVVCGQAMPVAAARKLAAHILTASDEAERWLRKREG
jgi:hypothetical protein